MWAGQAAASASAPPAPEPVTCGHYDYGCHHRGAPATPSIPAQGCCVAHCLLTALPLSAAILTTPKPWSPPSVGDLDAPGRVVEPAVPPPRA
jgi:hypothetical protein